MFSECSTVFVPHSILPVFFSPRSPLVAGGASPSLGPKAVVRQLLKRDPLGRSTGPGTPCRPAP